MEQILFNVESNETFDNLAHWKLDTENDLMNKIIVSIKATKMNKEFNDVVEVEGRAIIETMWATAWITATELNDIQQWGMNLMNNYLKDHIPKLHGKELNPVPRQPKAEYSIYSSSDFALNAVKYQGEFYVCLVQHPVPPIDANSIPIDETNHTHCVMRCDQFEE